MRESFPETMGSILRRLGVEDVVAYDAVAEAIEAEFTKRGLRAKVEGIRWGSVTIVAPRNEASQVAWMRLTLGEIATKASNGNVTTVRIRVGEPRDQSVETERNRT
jgi:hypothetical protein